MISNDLHVGKKYIIIIVKFSGVGKFTKNVEGRINAKTI